MTEQEIADFCIKNKIKSYKRKDRNLEVEFQFHDTAFIEDVDYDELIERMKKAKANQPKKRNKFRG